VFNILFSLFYILGNYIYLFVQFHFSCGVIVNGKYDFWSDYVEHWCRGSRVCFHWNREGYEHYGLDGWGDRPLGYFDDRGDRGDARGHSPGLRSGLKQQEAGCRMILELFAVLIGVALLAVFLGYYTGELAYAMVGLAFLFLIGILVLAQGISYSVGSNINANIDGTEMSAVTVYGSMDSGTSHFFGYFLCVAGVAGLALLFVNYRRAHSKSEDDY